MESSRTTMSTSTIGRKLGLSFAAVALLAVAQCIGYALSVSHVEQAATLLGRAGRARYAALELRLALSAQADCVGYAVAQGADAERRLDRTRVESAAQRLAALAPAGDRAHIAAIASVHRDFERVVREDVAPAARRGDADAARKAHARAESLLLKAEADVEAYARRFAEGRSLDEASVLLPTQLSQLSALGILAIVAVAGSATIWIRRAVTAPLARLTDAAAAIGRGQSVVRIQGVGHGEFGQLAGALERMSAQLARREAELVGKERMAAIGQVAAGVAHELNNPIGIIRGYLRVLLPEVRDPRVRDQLRILDEEAAACQRITDDLLAYARSPEVKTELLDVAALAESVALRFAATREAKGVRVDVRAAPALLLVDEVRLRQVLHNLLKNAAEAGTREIVIRGAASPEDGYALSVLDRGRGIRDEDRQRVFEPFYTGRRGGTGLGLSVSLGIVRAHGGSIAALPREGGGSELRVTLPFGSREPDDTLH